MEGYQGRCSLLFVKRFGGKQKALSGLQSRVGLIGLLVQVVKWKLNVEQVVDTRFAFQAKLWCW